MNIPKWQGDFQPQPEDRFMVQKSSLIDTIFLKKYLMYSASTLVVLGTAWYLFSPLNSTSDEDLPIVKAPEHSHKIKPVNQDFDQESIHNKTIYEKLSAKKTSDEKVEHLLQEPEEPIAPPPTLSAEFVGNLMNDDRASDDNAPRSETTSQEIVSSNQSLSETAASKAVEDQNQRQQALKMFFHEDELAENSVPQSDDRINYQRELASDDSVEKPMAVTVTGSSVKSQTPTNTLPSSGDQTPTHWIQLASMKTKEAAEREWKRLSHLARLKPLLLRHKPKYGSVDMGEGEGVHYRIRIGLLPLKEAKILCAKLRDLKVDCIVKKNQ